MLIACDFDGTLQFADGSPNYALIKRLKREQRNGNIIILWTCRADKRLLEAVIFLKQNGFTPDLVNENAPQTIRRLGYNPRKVLADIYIDNKNSAF